MKKLLCIASISIFGILNGYSQNKGDIELGVGAGINFTNVSSYDGEDNAAYLTALNAGISGEYYFSDRWGLKSKLIYENKGWSNGTISFGNSDIIESDFVLTYITLPVMANWHFGSKRNWYLNFGPYVGFLVDAEDSKLELDLKDAFNSTDFGLALGIGYKFEISDRTKLYIEYDGQAGLSDIFEDNSGDAVRNNRSSLNLGVLFNL
jgi:opacity protein-like surface antigen